MHWFFQIVKDKVLRFPKKTIFGCLVTALFALFPFVTHATVLDDYILGAIAWILFAFVWVLGQIVVLLVAILVYISQYNGFVDAAVVTTGWAVVRDIANMFFVLILLMISFGTILRLEQYQLKKLLPKVLLMAILVNFSKAIAGLLIDASQIVMLTFVAAYQSAGPGNLLAALGLPEILTLNPNDNSIIGNMDIVGGVILALIYVLIAAVVVLAFVAILVVRMVMLWILIVLSPFAYVLSVIPSGQRYASQWWEQFSKYVIVGPVIAFFLWLSLATLPNLTSDPQFADISTLRSESSSSLDTGTEVGGVEVGLTNAGDPSRFFTMVVAIAMLMASMMFAMQIGGVAGQIASKVAQNPFQAYKPLTKGLSYLNERYVGAKDGRMSFNPMHHLEAFREARAYRSDVRTRSAKGYARDVAHLGYFKSLRAGSTQDITKQRLTQQLDDADKRQKELEIERDMKKGILLDKTRNEQTKEAQGHEDNAKEMEETREKDRKEITDEFKRVGTELKTAEREEKTAQGATKSAERELEKAAKAVKDEDAKYAREKEKIEEEQEKEISRKITQKEQEKLRQERERDIAAATVGMSPADAAAERQRIENDNRTVTLTPAEAAAVRDEVELSFAQQFEHAEASHKETRKNLRHTQRDEIIKVREKREAERKASKKVKEYEGTEVEVPVLDNLGNQATDANNNPITRTVKTKEYAEETRRAADEAEQTWKVYDKRLADYDKEHKPDDEATYEEREAYKEGRKQLENEQALAKQKFYALDASALELEAQAIGEVPGKDGEEEERRARALKMEAAAAKVKRTEEKRDEELDKAAQAHAIAAMDDRSLTEWIKSNAAEEVEKADAEMGALRGGFLSTDEASRKLGVTNQELREVERAIAKLPSEIAAASGDEKVKLQQQLEQATAKKSGLDERAERIKEYREALKRGENVEDLDQSIRAVAKRDESDDSFKQLTQKEREDKLEELEKMRFEKDTLANMSAAPLSEERSKQINEELDEIKKEKVATNNKLAATRIPRYYRELAQRELIGEELKKLTTSNSEELVEHFRLAKLNGDQYKMGAVLHKLANDYNDNEVLNGLGYASNFKGYKEFFENEVRPVMGEQAALSLANDVSFVNESRNHWDTARTVTVDSRTGDFRWKTEMEHTAEALAEIRKQSPRDIAIRFNRLAYGGEVPQADGSMQFELGPLGMGVLNLLRKDLARFIDRRELQKNAAINIHSYFQRVGVPAGFETFNDQFHGYIGDADPDLNAAVLQAMRQLNG